MIWQAMSPLLRLRSRLFKGVFIDRFAAVAGGEVEIDHGIDVAGEHAGVAVGKGVADAFGVIAARAPGTLNASGPATTGKIDGRLASGFDSLLGSESDFVVGNLIGAPTKFHLSTRKTLESGDVRITGPGGY